MARESKEKASRSFLRARGRAAALRLRTSSHDAISAFPGSGKTSRRPDEGADIRDPAREEHEFRRAVHALRNRPGSDGPARGPATMGTGPAAARHLPPKPARERAESVDWRTRQRRLSLLGGTAASTHA